MELLKIINRDNEIFKEDIISREKDLSNTIKGSRILILGGAGTIGQSLAKEFFIRDPKTLDIIDISENNLVELVRDIRSSECYGNGSFNTYALDINSRYFDAFIDSQKSYDFICNLSAMKHVRSEKDPFSLMRMIETNIFNSLKCAKIAKSHKSKNYFAVSTDKAANPVNLMGASKRIMEKFLINESKNLNVSMARFANVAFSDGSLLSGFNQRVLKKQPISAPNDVFRYFLTPKESGQLCLLASIFGEKLNIFFPSQNEEMKLTLLSEVAKNFITNLGYEPIICSTEDEARSKAGALIAKMKWPLYLFSSDTTGEKLYEEFYMPDEAIDFTKFKNIGVIKSALDINVDLLDLFTDKYIEMCKSENFPSKENIVDLFLDVLPELNHEEKGRYLHDRM